MTLTVQFRRDRLIREYAVLRLKSNGRWHRVSLAFAEFLLRHRKARCA